ncbi:hypothetical protein EVAR_36868_1 [Eumeta japonica]|uniref:Uncharacterized protein n=1 Tax=Eumeta variegata TaxID=151549 RepID=A0A4C1WV61_EUMVA|nr:hypothetical protein EVAR_36868_1 [Eumeta japonica]
MVTQHPSASDPRDIFSKQVFAGRPLGSLLLLSVCELPPTTLYLRSFIIWPEGAGAARRGGAGKWQDYFGLEPNRSTIAANAMAASKAEDLI